MPARRGPRIGRGDHVEVGEGHARRRAGGGATSTTAPATSGTASSASRKSGCWKLTRRALRRRPRGGRGSGPAAAPSRAPVSTITWRAPARASMAARARSVACDRRGEAALEARVGGVDQAAAAGLEVAQVHRAHARASRARARSRTSTAITSWRRPSVAERPLEAGLEREVGDHDDRAAVAGDAPERRDGAREVGAPGGPSSGGDAVERRPARRPGRGGRRAAGAPGRCRRPGWRARPSRSPRRRSTTPTPASTSWASSSLVCDVRAEGHRGRAVDQRPGGQDRLDLGHAHHRLARARALSGQSTQRTSSPVLVGARERRLAARARAAPPPLALQQAVQPPRRRAARRAAAGPRADAAPRGPRAPLADRPATAQLDVGLRDGVDDRVEHLVRAARRPRAPRSEAPRGGAGRRGTGCGRPRA